MKTYKDKEDIVDKLVIHLAQSKAYIAERGLKETLGWRAKTGTLTQEDVKCIEWAKEFLSSKPIYIKK